MSDGGIDLHFLNNGGIELHGDEIEKFVKGILAAARDKFGEKMDLIFETGFLQTQCRHIVRGVDARKYWLQSSYRRDAVNCLKVHLPPLKSKEIKQLITTTSNELSQELQKVASQSVHQQMLSALGSLGNEIGTLFEKTLWGILGEVLGDIGKVALRILTFGLAGSCSDESQEMSKIAVTKIESVGVVKRSCAGFAQVLSIQEKVIMEYVRKKLINDKLVAKAQESLVLIEEVEEDAYKETQNAVKFAPLDGLIWCDPNIDNAENRGYCERLETSFGECFHKCKEPETANKIVQDNPITRFKVITAGTNGERVAGFMCPETRPRINVDEFLVFCRTRHFHETWVNKLPKQLGATVHTDVSSVVSQLATISDRPLQAFMSKADIMFKLAECQRVSQHSQVQDFADQLDTKECTRQLLEARDETKQVSEADAQEWSQMLESSDSGSCMRLWSREAGKFCYTLTTEMRRGRHDKRLLKSCRLAQIVAGHHTKLGRESGFRGPVYRGLNIHHKTVYEQYTESKGKCLFFREFMATSKKESVAQGFSNRGNGEYKVILRIDATDFHTAMPAPLMIKAWSTLPHEEEVLFPLFTCFEVTAVDVQNKTATLDLKCEVAIPDPTAAFIYAFL